MKLKVPFVRNLKKWKGSNWCGAIALASILRYYKDRSKVEDIIKTLNIPKGGISQIALTYFCLKNGFKVDYINKHKTFSYNRKEYSPKFVKFLKKFKVKEQYEKFTKKCEQYKDFKFIHKTPTIKDIEKYLNQKKPVLLSACRKASPAC